MLCDGSLDAPSASEWTQEKDGTLVRTVCLPGGADMEECLRQVGGFNDAEIAEIVERHPTVPDIEIMLLER
jgi:hypothetical protein